MNSMISPYEVKNGGDDESINFPSFLNGKTNLFCEL